MGVVKKIITGHLKVEPVSPSDRGLTEERACVSSTRLGSRHRWGRAGHEASGSKSRGVSGSSQEWLLPQPEEAPSRILCPHADQHPLSPATITSLNHQLLLVPGGVKRAGNHHLEPRPWRKLQTSVCC